MANYSQLKAAINAAIKTNGNKEITGAALQTVLDNIVNVIGANYTFAGVATPSTNPGTPDQNVVYFTSQEGTYTNFGGVVLPAGIHLLMWNGSWSTQTFFTVDDEPTQNSNNLVKSGGVFVNTLPVINKTLMIATESQSGYINAAGQLVSHSSSRVYSYSVTPGLKYCINAMYNSSWGGFYIINFFDSNDNLITHLGYLTSSFNGYDNYVVVVPENATVMKVCTHVNYINIYFVKELGKTPYDIIGCQGVLPSCNLDSVTETGKWVLTENSYQDTPDNVTEGFFSVETEGSFILQTFLKFDGTAYMRKFTFSDVAGTWKEVNGLKMKMRGYLSSCDLNDVKETGTWLLISNNTYQNVPDNGSTGFLRVSVLGDYVLQEYYSWSGASLYKRKFNIASTSIEDWVQVSGVGDVYNITNNYKFNNTQQTVNLTASPQITSDTNNYLAPTGDDTDRTADILAMLQSTGICRLGAGTYWVDSLVMPNLSAIIGSGAESIIRLKAGNDKFAIKMGSYCQVKNVSLWGDTSAITPSATVGTRHGILWQGNYTSDQNSSHQPMMGTVSDVFICRFDGGGITCTDTGYGTRNYIAVTNVHIDNCCVGLNISYWSEFHKFTNVRTYDCYYGCINNGGNNMFVNCDFSSCREIAFLMDNSQGQSPNNSHGSCIGCVFNHTAHNGVSNSGIGIKILNCANGFIFDGCQIFYSQIYIEDSQGIVISSCNLGEGNIVITIDGGGTVLFANNMHAGAPTISITDNTKVHFVNCYNKSTGALIGN